MSRAVIAVDRIAAALIGLILLAAGAYALAWSRRGVLSLPQQLQTTGLSSLTEQGWWPLALGLTGLILVLFGLRWLAAHIPERAMPTLRVPGSDNSGRLTVSSQAVADAAAEELEQTAGVESARARLIYDRGQAVLSMHSVITADADLEAIGTAADVVTAHVIDVTARNDLRCRIQLSVNRSG